jgi:hypothetical protein
MGQWLKEPIERESSLLSMGRALVSLIIPDHKSELAILMDFCRQLTSLTDELGGRLQENAALMGSGC